MGKVSYKVSDVEIHFTTDLQFNEGDDSFRFEEQLMEAIKEHKQRDDEKRKTGIIHDIKYENDIIIATAPDFKKHGNLNVQHKPKP